MLIFWDIAGNEANFFVRDVTGGSRLPLRIRPGAPTSSIDFSIASGEFIPIEERDPEEVTCIWGHRIAPEGVKVRNLAFDVTPAKYITGIITEKGVFKPQDLHKLKEMI